MTVAALVVFLAGSTGCVQWTHHLREHCCIGDLAKGHAGHYYHCPHCGKIVPLDGFNGCPHCKETPSFYGYEATCWRQFPQDWGCTPEHAIGSELHLDGMLESGDAVEPTEQLPPAMILEEQQIQSSGDNSGQTPISTPVRAELLPYTVQKQLGKDASDGDQENQPPVIKQDVNPDDLDPGMIVVDSPKEPTDASQADEPQRNQVPAKTASAPLPRKPAANGTAARTSAAPVVTEAEEPKTLPPATEQSEAEASESTQELETLPEGTKAPVAEPKQETAPEPKDADHIKTAEDPSPATRADAPKENVSAQPKTEANSIKDMIRTERPEDAMQPIIQSAKRVPLPMSAQLKSQRTETSKAGSPAPKSAPTIAAGGRSKTEADHSAKQTVIDQLPAVSRTPLPRKTGVLGQVVSKPVKRKARVNVRVTRVRKSPTNVQLAVEPKLGTTSTKPPTKTQTVPTPAAPITKASQVSQRTASVRLPSKKRNTPTLAAPITRAPQFSNRTASVKLPSKPRNLPTLAAPIVKAPKVSQSKKLDQPGTAIIPRDAKGPIPIRKVELHIDSATAGEIYSLSDEGRLSDRHGRITLPLPATPSMELKIPTPPADLGDDIYSLSDQYPEPASPSDQPQSGNVEKKPVKKMEARDEYFPAPVRRIQLTRYQTGK